MERGEKEKDAALRLSHDEVRRLAATAERERIGRDLHDLFGHTLSLITLILELARKLSEREPASSRRELAEAERVARHVLAEVRSAVTGIRSASSVSAIGSRRTDSRGRKAGCRRHCEQRWLQPRALSIA